MIQIQIGNWTTIECKINFNNWGGLHCELYENLAVALTPSGLSK